jgi:restriction system protein
MAIPDYQSLLLPVLQVASDGNEHSLSQTIETIARQLGLSEADRDELLPSGKQRKFDNRVSWARTYLQKALLLSSPGRSKFRITERGMKVLKENPPQINVKYLRQFPEFIAFHTHADRDGKSEDNNHTTQEILEKTSQTPQEILEASYQSLRQTLAQELLERIKNSPPKFFESLVVDLLVAMG